MAQPAWPLLVLGSLAMNCGADRSGPMVHHLNQDAITASGSAPGSVAVVAVDRGRTYDAQTWATLYQQQPTASFDRSAHLTVLALGPLVDSPDQVSPSRMSRVGSVFTVTVVHTKVRLQSTELRKNVPWRPLVEIPLPSLDPGSYRVEVVWQAVETVAAPKLLSEPIKRATGFVISSR